MTDRHHRLGAYGITAALGLFGTGALVQTCDPPSPTPTPAPAPAPEPEPAPAPAANGQMAVNDQVVALVNQERAAHGLAPLVTDARLVAAAERHSADMAATSTMSHTGSDGSNGGTRIAAAGYPGGTWAENLGAGQSDAGSVMSAWMNSPGHRDNILSDLVVHIGVAAVRSADGVPYWTMDLAAGG